MTSSSTRRREGYRTTSANSSLGNGNLRPETLSATRRERPSQPGNPAAETGSIRTGHGNLGLFPTLRNHVGSR